MSDEKIRARDQALRRLRRHTLNAGILALGLTGALAAFVGLKTKTSSVAQSTEPAVTHTVSGLPVVPAPTATVSSGTSPQPASQSPPQTTPSASSSAPVAVSGGS